MITKAVILCGGLGTRFLPISKSIPKEMLPVLNKPIIQYVVEEISQAGIKDILVVVGRGKESIIEHFDKNVEVEKRLEKTKNKEALAELKSLASLANIHFIRQIEPKGTGHAVLCAKSFVGDAPFLLHFGDELFVASPSRTGQLIDEFKRTGRSTIAVGEVEPEQVSRYGIIKPVFERGIRVDDIIEKPKMESAPGNLAFIGAAVLTRDIFEHILIDKRKLECGITDALSSLAHKKNLYAASLIGTRLDVGSPRGLIEANNFLAKNSVPPII